MGNCGVGFAPTKPNEREFMIRVMEGVEEIPGAALEEGMTWNWEYWDEIEAMNAPLMLQIFLIHHKLIILTSIKKLQL